MKNHQTKTITSSTGHTHALENQFHIKNFHTRKEHGNHTHTHTKTNVQYTAKI